jgi:hypothetical protein
VALTLAHTAPAVSLMFKIRGLLKVLQTVTVTKMIVEPSCKTAHSLPFAEIAKDQQGQRWKVRGRERSSFLNVLALVVKYLYSNTPGGQTLDDLHAEA